MKKDNPISEQIDWSWLGLQDEASRGHSPREKSLLAIRTLRRHEDPFFGFDSGYLQRVRTLATPADMKRAAEGVDRALEGDLFFPPHSNAFAALGPETLCLAMNAERSHALADKVVERQADWDRNIWAFGITHGVATLLRYLCPLKDVADETLLPIVEWLCAIAPVEWRGSRGWGERMLGASGHNWYVRSFSGLWMSGALFGCFRPLQGFRSLAPTYLEREVALLFASDGWSKEGAAGYHANACLNVIAFWRLARRHGYRFSDGFEQRLRTLADATWRMQGPDGNGPFFGDASPSAAGKQEASPVFPAPGYGLMTRRLAAVFGLSEAKSAVETLDPVPDLTFLPYEGEDLAEAYRRLPAESPPLDTALPASGLFAMRSRWTPDADWMAINAMPIGPRVTSHKHADLLNLELCARGRRVLVDNWYGDVTADDGSYKTIPEIRNDPMKRRWRVGSSAHNVPTVDNTDIVPVEQIYRYGWNETPLVDGWTARPEYAWFSAVHEAYRRLERPVAAVRRKVFYLRGEYWVLMDRFTADGDSMHDYTQHFFMPESERTGTGGVRTPGSGGNLLIVPVAGASGALTIEPCPHPITRYQNPDHLRLDTRGDDVVMAVVLVPFDGDKAPAVEAALVPVTTDGEELSPWEMTGIEIRLPDRTDYLVCQHLHQNHPWSCAGHAGTGRLFHSRLGELEDQPPGAFPVETAGPRPDR